MNHQHQPQPHPHSSSTNTNTNTNTNTTPPSTVRVPAVPLSAAAKISLKTAILTSNSNGNGSPTPSALAQCLQFGLPNALVVRSVTAFYAKKREYIRALVNMGKATPHTNTLPAPIMQHLVDGIVNAVATATATAAAAAAQAKMKKSQAQSSLGNMNSNVNLNSNVNDHKVAAQVQSHSMKQENNNHPLNYAHSINHNQAQAMISSSSNDGMKNNNNNNAAQVPNPLAPLSASMVAAGVAAAKVAALQLQQQEQQKLILKQQQQQLIQSNSIARGIPSRNNDASSMNSKPSNVFSSTGTGSVRVVGKSHTPVNHMQTSTTARSPKPQHQQQHIKPQVQKKPPAPAPVSAADLWRKKMTQEFLNDWDWSKPQSGLFLKTHDGKFIVAPKSLGAVPGRPRQHKESLKSAIKYESSIVKNEVSSVKSVNDVSKDFSIDEKQRQVQPMELDSKYESPFMNEEDKTLFEEAYAIQQRLRLNQLAAKPTPGQSQALQDAYNLLVDPLAYRRFKVEPRKEGKLVERTLKKSRAGVADLLIRGHKDFLKAITSHQSEFIRFHRNKRSEVAKLARAVRDQIDRKLKQKERDADLVERERLAALKANDMRAYSSLLEETKNERLKFLLSKTDEYINQVSNLLSEQRAEETGYDTALDRRSTEGSYFLSAHVKKEQVRQASILVGGDLKEYQLAGLQWLVSLYNNRLNGILADEMGLGKTIQTISLLAYLIEVKDNKGPFLVVVPLSTLSNWVNEFAKWCPSVNVITFKGNPQQRKDIYREQVAGGNFNVLLTTYEYIIRDKGSLRKVQWQYCIVDEGHRMKNANSKFAVTLGTQYSTRYRVLLTGTPLQNNLPELWALLNFLLPSIFNSVETFEQWFNRPFSSFNTGTDSSNSDDMLSSEEQMLIIHRLHELLRPFMLRRVKSEVLDQLPEKVEKVVRCELSSWQRFLYKQLSKSLADPGASNARGLNNVVMQLRKVCNHPYLFLPPGMGYVINEAIIRSSGKFELLDRMLPKLKAAGHRVLLFTQMVQVISLLEDYFKFRGYMSLRLDGSTTAEEREKRMYQFNAPDSPYFVFLLSTRAGGLGLNLATADTVIIFDSDWNPMMDMQAQDRAHRIGQRNDVRVFRLISNSPVEEKILSRATEKLTMNELVVEAGKFDSNEADLDRSLERQQLMKDILLDLPDASNTQEANSQDETSSQVASDVGDAVDEGEEKENLNEMLSTNEEDYQLYHEIDKMWSKTGVKKGLYEGEDMMPDWIKFPKGTKATKAITNVVVSGGREKKKVVYDDGLTEKQFLRMMENGGPSTVDPDSVKKAAPQIPATTLSDNPANATFNNYFPAVAAPTASRSRKNIDIPPDALPTDITNKLVNTTKAIIYFKEVPTKRRLAEVFLERPSPQMYPDYYHIIKEPIGMNDILRKCRARLFSEVKQWFDDWRLLFNNARKYNPEGSWVVNDANALEKELDRITGKNGLAAMLPKPAPKPLRIKLSLKRLQKGESGAQPKAKRGRIAVSSLPVEGNNPDTVGTKKKGKATGKGSRGGRGAYKKREKKL